MWECSIHIQSHPIKNTNRTFESYRLQITWILRTLLNDILLFRWLTLVYKVQLSRYFEKICPKHPSMKDERYFLQTKQFADWFVTVCWLKLNQKHISRSFSSWHELFWSFQSAKTVHKIKTTNMERTKRPADKLDLGKKIHNILDWTMKKIENSISIDKFNSHNVNNMGKRPFSMI